MTRRSTIYARYRRLGSSMWWAHPHADACRHAGGHQPASLRRHSDPANLPVANTARLGHLRRLVPIRTKTSERTLTQSPIVRVMTVDDQAAFRSVAREVIEATPGFQHLGEAKSGEAALALVGELGPDLVLLDVCMPGLDGVETARRLSASFPELMIVLISAANVED